jgi:hypothetical protein
VHPQIEQFLCHLDIQSAGLRPVAAGVSRKLLR